MDHDVSISVVIPLYNKAQWVSRAIASVRKQSVSAMEIIVIDDGSTDGGAAIVAALDDGHIKLVTQENAGVSTARNKGIEEAKGAFVAFLDADDRWEPCHLEVLLKGFETYPEIVMSANRVEERLEEEDHARTVSDHCMACFKQEQYLWWLSRNRFPIHIGSVMFRSRFLNAVPLRFFVPMRMGEDVNFMLRASLKGSVAFSDYTGLIYYRDDRQSAMYRRSNESKPVPGYIEGINIATLDIRERTLLKRFLRTEYLKKAYQNRGTHFRSEEMTRAWAGGISVGMIAAAGYLAIRFVPEFIFVFYRTLNKVKIFRLEYWYEGTSQEHL